MLGLVYTGGGGSHTTAGAAAAAAAPQHTHTHTFTHTDGSEIAFSLWLRETVVLLRL